MDLLVLDKVTKTFEGIEANKEVSITVREHEIVGLIGPNGAGKTTLFSCISGSKPPTSGKVFFRGEDITGTRPDVVCKKGIARTFQIVKTFAGMTVLENVMIGALNNTGSPRVAREQALEVLNFTGLYPKRDLEAGQITLVDKKRVELARALATRPQLLMLDEVCAGLHPNERGEAVLLIEKIREQGYTVFIIEHVMDVLMPISDRIVVLNYGAKIAEGTPEEVAGNPLVRKAYLGERYGEKYSAIR